MKIIPRSNKREVSRSDDRFTDMLSLRDAMDRLFNESIWSPFALDSERREGFVPRVDVSEKEHEVKVRVDVPGVKPEDVNIEVTEDSVTISGSSEKTEEEKKENYYCIERQSGQFFREFALPARIDPKSVEAKTKNGVVSIVLKKQPSEERQKVKIQPE